MKLFIITGKKQSGKSTSVDFLSSQLIQKGSVGIYSFATPLKEFLQNVFDLSYNQCNGSDAEKNTSTKVKWKDLPFSEAEINNHYNLLTKKWISDPDEYISARQLMQIFGSNICRRMYADCWANATKKKIVSDSLDFAFIADARFPNEIEVFKDVNPIVIRLLRNPYNDSHISETSLDKFDWRQFNSYIIDNSNMTIDVKNHYLNDVLQENLS